MEYTLCDLVLYADMQELCTLRGFYLTRTLSGTIALLLFFLMELPLRFTWASF
ncbi:hypothetical protein ACFS7Z_16260 [Pontibacter toksunensis]|uniref:Uncharacterized protein n=1 Tax=Pontibacter toksunensis TaxID=1332631 RepID=A0ABW6BW11_9BACT